MREDDAIFALYGGLPRHAPGSSASTQRAAEIARPHLPAKPLALDLGCGIGRSATILSKTLGATVVGLDVYRPFLTVAGRSGLPTVEADMTSPPFAPSTFDLIWAEGALYQMGVERGLSTASRLLRDQGVVGFTELCWLASKPPADAQRFWSREYPAMRDVAALRSVAQKVGYEVLESFRLPVADWEQEYYRPLRRRIAELAPLAHEWKELRTMLSATRQELLVFDRHGDSFGYVFLVLRKL